MIGDFTYTGLFLSFFIASGGMTSMVISLLIFLSIREKQLFHYLHGGFFFVFGFCILCDPYSRLGTESFAPYLLYMNYPLIFLVGPFFYYYFRSLMDRKFSFSVRHIFSLIPFLITLIIFIPYYVKSNEEKIALFPLNGISDGVVKTLYRIIELSMFPWSLVWVLFAIYRFWNRYYYIKDNHDRAVKFASIYLLGSLVVMMVILVTDALNLFQYYTFGILGLILIMLFLGVVTFRYPHFFIQVRMESSAARYAKSRLSKPVADDVVERIEDLMSLERIYENPDLTINDLSRSLKITPRELSEIINTRYQKNFRNFINAHRVDAARKNLVNRPGESILSVCFACGFNSKSNFNRVFMDSVGMTPTEFRNRNSRQKRSLKPADTVPEQGKI